MQYVKKEDGTLAELPQKNVDFGGGLERLVAAVNNNPDIFTVDVFSSIIRIIELNSRKKYRDDERTTKAMRIIADHMRAAVFMIADGVMPSNKQQGYVLRRLIRRSLVYAKRLELPLVKKQIHDLTDAISQSYKEAYPTVWQKKTTINDTITSEVERFQKTLDRGLREIEKEPTLDGKKAFFYYESFGFPWEMTEEFAREKGLHIDRKAFEQEFHKHKERSRTASSGMFKGGLADHSEQVIKLHTATHLLHQALRDVLGKHVSQKGSNITAERLRFDFSHPQKLTLEEIKNVEDVVNSQIKKNLAVHYVTLPYKQAIEQGALAFFGERYGDMVKVYSIGPSTGSGQAYSKEVCGGPHVDSTKSLGQFKIVKEEGAGSQVRRIYATVLN